MKKIFTGCSFLLLAFAAKAQLISLEDFNYPTGNITGNNGGTGWSGPWLTTTFNASNTTITSPGLTQPPQVNGVGNKNHQVGNDYRNFRYMDTTSALALSLMDNAGDPGATSSTNYRWGNAYGKDGTTIWFSLLINRANNTQGYGGMHLMYGMNLAFDQYGDKRSHQRFQFGADNSHTRWMLSRTINQNPNLPSACSYTVQGNTTVNTTMHLLVIRIDFKAGPENAYQWVDPISCQQPDTALADVKMYNICDFRFNAVNVGAGNSANFDMDELRIGLTYNDVVNCSTGGLNEFEPFIIQKFVFPNPNDGHFNVRFNSASGGTSALTVTDLLGQTVQTQEIELREGHNEFPFDESRLENGIYMVNLRTADGISVTQRVVVQK